MVDLMAWLAEREPAPPEELRRRLVSAVAERGSSGETLGVAAMAQLHETLTRPGRDREAAFHLLVADALLTYACEAATDKEDMEGSLCDLLERLDPDVNRSAASIGE